MYFGFYTLPNNGQNSEGVNKCGDFIGKLNTYYKSLLDDFNFMNDY